MGKPLIITKCLIPGRRADLLRRPRLIDFIHEHVDRKLVLVCAPAGYGKTSLLIEFAREADLPVCWYSLDSSDRNLRVFVEYLLAALRQRFPDFGRQAQELLASSELLSDIEALVGVLVNEIYEEIPDYFLLVLDDYHLVDPSEPVNYFLDSLLQHLPDNCHLIISSRAIPTLTPRGLALLTARQEVAGLGARELRFTPQEIQELMRQNLGQSVPDEVAQELARQSEGWITGIVLSTQSMWRDLIAGAARARSMGASVYEYLAAEVFHQQTPEVQRFLLASAILDEMSSRRCDALLDETGSAAMLDLLEEGNVFIVRIEREQERWYRYHALFHSFLREKLAADSPAWASELRLRAAAILEQDGEWDAAFRHYLLAGSTTGAVQVVLRAGQEMYEAGRLETLAEWIDRLPAEAVADVPRLLWYRARVHAETGEWAEALGLYERAREGFGAQGDGEAATQTLVDAAVSQRFLGRVREAIESCRQALAALDGIGRDLPMLAAGARRNLGICLCQVGQAPEGIEQLRRSLELYREADSAYGLALTHDDLGVALALAGNIAAATVHHKEALRLWQQIGHLAHMANSLNSLGVSQQFCGEYEEALPNLERALDCAQRAGSRRLRAHIWAGLGDLYRETGRWEEATQAYGEAWRLAETLRDSPLLCYLMNASAEVHRARNEYPPALALARQAYEQALEQGLAQDAARYETTLAAIYLEQGNPVLALEYLERVLETLKRSRAGRELALAWLQWARVMEATGEARASRDGIRRMVEVTLELGYDHFLVQEVARAHSVVEAAAAAGVGGDVLADLLRRVRQRATAVRPRAEAAEREPAPPRIRIRVLGECSVSVDDRLLTLSDWGTAKARELFFYLLSFPSRRKEQIAQVLWPDLPSGRLRGVFHITLYRLRRALGDSECVLYENEQYAFNRQLDHWCDVDEFEAAVGSAERLQADDPRAAEEVFERACALYGGEFLAGMRFPDDDWCFWRREELARRYQSALQALGDLRLARADHAGALEAYRRLLASDPLREDIHRTVMRCLALSGDRSGALQHYRTAAELLQEQLGVQPLAETEDLYRAIATGREELVV